MEMEYRYIWAWNFITGSYPYYIKNLIEQAKRDKAPSDALYFGGLHGRWVCLSDLAPDHSMRARMEQAIANRSQKP